MFRGGDGHAQRSGEAPGPRAAPGEETGSQQQGKTREVKLGGEVLYRSGHSVNGVIDLVFI